MSNKLKAKTIIVTGGSMGIGLAIAKECAREGAQLILVSRHREDLKLALDELNKISENNNSMYELDVSIDSDVKLFSDKLKEEGTIIDGIVNSAAIIGPIGLTGDLDASSFEETIRINLLGTLNMCRHFIPLIKKSTRGKLVNLSGGGATTPLPNYSAYAVSKVGVVRLTENIAIEYKDQNIEANAISPGFVVTRIHQGTLQAGDKAGKEYLKKTIENIEKGGVDIEKSAKLAVFLLSPLSNGITGKLLSAEWDPWIDEDFQKRLNTEKDFCTLRRIDDQLFFQNKN